ncbi:BA75_04215T0 [Komagataella pastoris]|uniref:BA75_04215T0 n=1 Tax=Komagataella pastoris TaxID=4922 RepID=A0A1B2JFN9_PICPA|nr:BA75_04215T0 [Komagataella pastoris]
MFWLNLEEDNYILLKGIEYTICVLIVVQGVYAAINHNQDHTVLSLLLTLMANAVYISVQVGYFQFVFCMVTVLYTVALIRTIMAVYQHFQHGRIKTISSLASDGGDDEEILRRAGYGTFADFGVGQFEETTLTPQSSIIEHGTTTRSNSNAQGQNNVASHIITPLNGVSIMRRGSSMLNSLSLRNNPILSTLLSLSPVVSREAVAAPIVKSFTDPVSNDDEFQQPLVEIAFALIVIAQLIDTFQVNQDLVYYSTNKSIFHAQVVQLTTGILGFFLQSIIYVTNRDDVSMIYDPNNYIHPIFFLIPVLNTIFILYQFYQYSDYNMFIEGPDNYIYRRDEMLNEVSYVSSPPY